MTDPNREESYRLRCSYEKRGRLRMLSHLEIAGALEKIIRRAELPFCVTRGFSPHMKISFGSALPVGIGSTCEIFDIFLKENIAEEVILQRLQRATVDDLPITACSYISRSLPAASVAYPQHTYRIECASFPSRFIIPDEITVVRKRKEKTLVPHEFIISGPIIDQTHIDITLITKPTGSLRIDTLIQHADIDAAVVSVTRISQHE